MTLLLEAYSTGVCTRSWATFLIYVAPLGECGSVLIFDELSFPLWAWINSLFQEALRKALTIVILRARFTQSSTYGENLFWSLLCGFRIESLVLYRSFCDSKDSFVRLWVHESMRVFHDRMSTDEDRVEFKVCADVICRLTFNWR